MNNFCGENISLEQPVMLFYQSHDHKTFITTNRIVPFQCHVFGCNSCCLLINLFERIIFLLVNFLVTQLLLQKLVKFLIFHDGKIMVWLVSITVKVVQNLLKHTDRLLGLFFILLAFLFVLFAFFSFRTLIIILIFFALILAFIIIFATL